MLDSLQSLFGLIVFLCLCYASSENRSAVKIRLIIPSLILQFVIALVLLKIPAMQHLFIFLNKVVLELQQATEAGTSFIFGFLGGAPLPFTENASGASYVLAFRALPLLLITSVLSALLVYWRILPLLMRFFSLLLEKTLGIGGAVGLSVSANAFIGMVESPLLIRPYLSKLTRSELFTVMCAGLATISGTMLALEASVISHVVPGAVGHLLSASLITLPGVILIGHLLIPETNLITTGKIAIDRGADSTMDAITKGTQTGLNLLLNIIAMIIVMVALVHMLNALLALFPSINGNNITLEGTLGLFMSPVTWLMGIPWSEAKTAGQLMGIKTILTEFLAYIELGKIPAEDLAVRSRIIMTYALCGFANFISLGIMLTGLIIMVPERRNEILELGFKSLIGGTIATSCTAAIIGIIL
ncbi:MAG: CNT family concentrative nucleoside transporter [Gammaproteobacteria bacterium]|jgi:CNT family concentrative nucleoside transporter